MFHIKAIVKSDSFRVMTTRSETDESYDGTEQGGI